MSASTKVRAVLLGLLAVLLVACESAVATEVTVRGQQHADIAVEVAFTGDVAEAIATSTELQRELEAVFTRHDLEVDRRFSADEVVYRADLPYQTLSDVSDLTGVGSLALDPSGDRDATITVQLVAPEALDRALRDGVANEPDAEALTAALRGSTYLTVKVVFPGGIGAVSSNDDLIVTGDDTSAEVEQPLTEYVTGSFTVTGTPGTPRRPVVPLLAGAAVLVAGAAIGARRREGR